MSLKLVPMICPECGGQIQIPPDIDTAYCTYCGTKIFVDDGSKTIHIHNYDEAELRRIEIEEQRRKEEKAEREERERQARIEAERHSEELARYKKKWRTVLVSTIAFVLVSVYIVDLLPTAVQDAIYLTTGIIVLFVWPGLFIKRPSKFRPG